MKVRVTTEGGYKDYGIEREIADGVLVREMVFASTEEIPQLLEDEYVLSLELTDEPLSGYDAHLTVTCVDVL